eukprot:TRINITY_DN936_c0_g1_i14.p1 TRINITY_DN936_c0_g1~~TRINITY_DN936_c0_g1_i14.p1  ORF type:complete len:404 (+),score=167.49 TRINITY_DN936_c0_g1_i14:134-1213(+)
MKALNHQNIVNLREVLASKSKLYIVMDLVRGGELFDTIERQGELDEALARKYFQQLVDGIHYCHRRGVCHRDLKPENLLVDEDGALKITDFGVSSMRGGAGGGASDLLYTACGTPYYCAPEIISGAEEGYSGVKIDAWSCGIILYLLVTGELPFLHDDMPRLYELINGCKVPYPPWMGGDVKDLISRLLVKDPARRYALEDVKKHVWFLVDYAPADAPTDSGRAGGSLESTDSDRPKHRATKTSAGSAGGGTASGSRGGGSYESGASGGSSGSRRPANLAATYEGRDLEDFVKDALAGKPQRKIDSIVQQLEEIDVDCVDDMQVVADTVGTADKMTKWLVDNPKIPSITAMRVARMFFG